MQIVIVRRFVYREREGGGVGGASTGLGAGLRLQRFKSVAWG